MPKSENTISATSRSTTKGGQQKVVCLLGKPKILSWWESKNIDVPAGYQDFRKYFQTLIHKEDPNYGKKFEE